MLDSSALLSTPLPVSDSLQDRRQPAGASVAQQEQERSLLEFASHTDADRGHVSVVIYTCSLHTR